MSNMRRVDKRQLNLNLPLETYQKCEHVRQSLKLKFVGQAAVILLEEATRSIELTAEDYEAIAQETRKNEQKRSHQA